MLSDLACASAVQVQLPTVDPAKQFAVDFRMQATSYAAYMMVRDYQTVSLHTSPHPAMRGTSRNSRALQMP